MNQKAVHSKYAADNGFSNPVFFIDDGVSGVTFDRPDFNRMIAEMEAGKEEKMRKNRVRNRSYFSCLVVLAGICFVWYLRESRSFAAQSYEDGNYAVEVALSGGSGKAGIETPTLLIVEHGTYYARITWSSSHYDYMIVDNKKYENENQEGGNSSFLIPIPAFDEEIPVIADTLAMGEPHEISYQLHFYSDSIDTADSLPQEGAKRVLILAAFIIVAGGILNHFANQKRKRDYLGEKRAG